MCTCETTRTACTEATCPCDCGYCLDQDLAAGAADRALEAARFAQTYPLTPAELAQLEAASA